MTRKWLTLLLPVVVCAALALGLLVAFNSRTSGQGQDTAAQQTVSDERAQWLLDEIIAGGIASRAKVARQIIPALNAYYRDHGEYPPYLFGGPHEISVGFSGAFDTLKQGSPDPLISGGYMDEYPRVWCKTKWILCAHFPTHMDPRGHDHWSCYFSTPDDVYALSPADDLDAMRTAYLRKANPDLEHYLEPGARATGEWPLYLRRYFVLGGAISEKGCESMMLWSAGTGAIEGHHERDYLLGDLACFGYQRGEWHGADEKHCWLWFYGHNTWTERHDPLPRTIDEAKRMLADPGVHLEWPSDDYFGIPGAPKLKGLDLVNARAGLLQPDGIPDHICLLFKLGGGYVAEVVRADDM